MRVGGGRRWFRVGAWVTRAPTELVVSSGEHTSASGSGSDGQWPVAFAALASHIDPLDQRFQADWTSSGR